MAEGDQTSISRLRARRAGQRAYFRSAMANVEIVIKDEPPAGQPLVELYQRAR
jgi:hypothetical protein